MRRRDRESESQKERGGGQRGIKREGGGQREIKRERCYLFISDYNG